MSDHTVASRLDHPNSKPLELGSPIVELFQISNQVESKPYMGVDLLNDEFEVSCWNEFRGFTNCHTSDFESTSHSKERRNAADIRQFWTPGPPAWTPGAPPDLREMRINLTPGIREVFNCDCCSSFLLAKSVGNILLVSVCFFEIALLQSLS